MITSARRLTAHGLRMVVLAVAMALLGLSRKIDVQQQRDPLDELSKAYARVITAQRNLADARAYVDSIPAAPRAARAS